MNDWTKPSTQRASAARAEPMTGWKSRALAALAAPPVVCLSLLIVAVPFRLLGVSLALQYMSVVGAVAAVAGAWLDLERLPNFLGNVFLTNRGDDRNYWVFGAYWAAVATSAVVCARLS